MKDIVSLTFTPPAALLQGLDNLQIARHQFRRSGQAAIQSAESFLLLGIGMDSPPKVETKAKSPMQMPTAVESPCLGSVSRRYTKEKQAGEYICGCTGRRFYY